MRQRAVRLWEDVGAVARLARTFHAAGPGPGPAETPAQAGALPESALFGLHRVSAPAVLATGDLSDAFALDRSTLAVAIADVSGKGVQAALVNQVVRSILRTLVRADCRPTVVLSRLDRLLRGSRLGSIYLTILLGRYDLTSGRLLYANAGHPPPLVVNCHRDTRAAGRVTGPILGILESAVWEEDEIVLGPGDRLVLFTDGALEAESPRGALFGEARLRAALSRHAGLGLASMCEETARDLDAFQSGRRHDDITLLALERRLPS